MQNQIIHVLILGVIYASAGWWKDNTETGRRLRDYLRNWRADGWIHLILCAGSVYILGVCAILAVGLAFIHLGL